MDYASIGIFEETNQTTLQKDLKDMKPTEDFSSLSYLKPQGARITNIFTKDNQLNIVFEARKSIIKGVMILKLRSMYLIRGPYESRKIYLSDTIIFENIEFITSEFDNQVKSIKGGMTAGVGMASTFVTLLSLPQAFILFKVFQTLDIYIFVDVEYPKNFEAFFKIISKTVIDYIPGLYEFLADDEGKPLPPRFTHFGYRIHIMKNLGPVFTIITVIGIIKILTFPFRNTKRRFLRKTLKSSSEFI